MVTIGRSGHTVPAFYAWGWGGQVIAVFPEHDAVAVFTGAHYNAAASSPAKILGAHVIPALLNADAAASPELSQSGSQACDGARPGQAERRRT
jgi:CubicO group peptidase (beta-lactamase class C family)